MGSTSCERRQPATDPGRFDLAQNKLWRKCRCSKTKSQGVKKKKRKKKVCLPCFASSDKRGPKSPPAPLPSSPNALIPSSVCRCLGAGSPIEGDYPGFDKKTPPPCTRAALQREPWIRAGGVLGVGGGLHPALASHAEVLQFREGDLRQRGALIASARPNQALGRRHASTSRALYQRDASRYDGKPTERGEQLPPKTNPLHRRPRPGDNTRGRARAQQARERERRSSRRFSDGLSRVWTRIPGRRRDLSTRPSGPSCPLSPYPRKGLVYHPCEAKAQLVRYCLL